MKALILLLLVVLCAARTKRGLQEYASEPVFHNSDVHVCDEPKDIFSYRIALYDFATKLFRKIGERSEYHFVYSPLSIWRILAAIAEGADSEAQGRLFQSLNISSDPCTRQRYYDITEKRIVPGPDVTITSIRTFIGDDSLHLKRKWLRFVLKNSMLNVISSPIKRYPLITAYHLRQVCEPSRKVNLDGNSIILDSMEYNGWWTTAFDDAVIKYAPFHDQSGTTIGAVDLMNVKRHVRMGYVPSLRAKIMELPVGLDNRYRMMFSMILDNQQNITTVETVTAELLYEAIESMQESRIPLDVAIPRFTMTSNIDVRSILEEIEFPNLWTDPGATRNVSNPPAMPSSFVQRASLTMRNYGLSPNPSVPEPPSNASTGLDPALGRDFIADRPFIYALLDAETYTFIMSGSFTQPTYSLEKEEWLK